MPRIVYGMRGFGIAIGHRKTVDITPQPQQDEDEVVEPPHKDDADADKHPSQQETPEDEPAEVNSTAFEVPATPSPLFEPCAGPNFEVPAFSLDGGNAWLPEGYDAQGPNFEVQAFSLDGGNAWLPEGYDAQGPNFEVPAFGFDGGNAWLPEACDAQGYDAFVDPTAEGVMMYDGSLFPAQYCGDSVDGQYDGSWGFTNDHGGALPWCVAENNAFAGGTWTLPGEAAKVTGEVQAPKDAEDLTAAFVDESPPPRAVTRSRGKRRHKRKVERLSRLVEQAKEEVAPSETASEASTPTSAPAQQQQVEHPINFTTVMLRNIPNKYSQEMLVRVLNKEFRGKFDFLYVPIDFKNSCNVGYGFINFRSIAYCREFVHKFHGVDVQMCLPGYNSKKVAEVTQARIQGNEENVRRLRNSAVMNELLGKPEWLPRLWDHRGVEFDFPVPNQPVPAVKSRRRGKEHSS